MKKAAPPFRTVLNVDESIPSECHAVVAFDHFTGTVSVARNARCSIKHECAVDDVFFSSEKEFDLWHDVLKTATKELWDGENISLILHGPAQNMSLFAGASSPSSAASASTTSPVLDCGGPSLPDSPGLNSNSGSGPQDTALNKILRALLHETKFREVPHHYKASVCVGSMLMDVHGTVSDVGATFEGALSDNGGDAVLDGYGEMHRMLMFPVTHEHQLVDFSSQLSSVCQPIMTSSDGPMLLMSVKLTQECSISTTRASYIRIVQLVNSPQAMEETMLAVAKTKTLSPLATTTSKAALDRISGSSQVVFVQSTTPDRAVEVLPIVAAGKGSVVRTELNNATTDVVAASHTFVLRRQELRNQLRELKQEAKELKLKLKHQLQTLQRAQQEANGSPTSGSSPPQQQPDHGSLLSNSCGNSILIPNGDYLTVPGSPTGLGAIRSGSSTPHRSTISPIEDDRTIKLEEAHFKFQQQAQITRRKLLSRISAAQEELNGLSSASIELRKKIALSHKALEQDKATFAEALDLMRRQGEAALADITARSIEDSSSSGGVIPRPLTALSFLKSPTKMVGNVTSLQHPTLRLRAATPDATAAQLRELIEEERQLISEAEASATRRSAELTSEIAAYRFHVCALLENCRSMKLIYENVESVAQSTSSYLISEVPKGHGLVAGIASELVRTLVPHDMSIDAERARFAL